MISTRTPHVFFGLVLATLACLANGQGPTAEKRLDSYVIDVGDWTETNIVVHGYSRQEETCMPFDAVLVIDQSGSMEGNDPENKRLTAASRFVTRAEAERCDIRIGLVSFSNTAQIKMDLTTDYSALRHKIEQLSDLGDGTNFVEAMNTSQEILSTQGYPGRNHAVVFLSDGYPEPVGQSASISYLLGQAITADIVYYTIALGPADRVLLGDMAERTGGTRCDATPSSLTSCYEEIFEDSAYTSVARNIVLHERLGPGLRARAASLSVSEGMSQPSPQAEQAFYAGTAAISFPIGRLRSGRERSVSFEITCDSLSPESPQESVDLQVDHPNEARLTYAFGSVSGIETPVEQRVVTCRRPGKLMVEKQFDSSTSTVSIIMKNNYLPRPDRTNDVRHIELFEGVGGGPSEPSAFQVRAASLSYSGDCVVSGINRRPIVISHGVRDVVLAKIDAIPPQGECQVTFAVDQIACSSYHKNPVTLNWGKEYTDDPSVNSVSFTPPDGLREQLNLPQKRVLLSNIDNCSGRPDIHLSPALAPAEFFRLPNILDATPSCAFGLLPYPLPAAFESPSIWIDSDQNGFVTDWTNEAHIRARLAGFVKLEGRRVIVAGQGDVFSKVRRNRVYVQFANESDTEAQFGTGARGHLYACQQQGGSGSLPSEFSSNESLISSTALPQVIPPYGVVRIAFDVVPNTLTAGSFVGVEVGGALHEIAKIRVTVPIATSTAAVEKHTDNNQAYELIEIRP